MALKVSMAYMTVSTPAALIVSGLIPAHLLAKERLETHRKRMEGNANGTDVRIITYQLWQLEWDASDKGR